MVVSRTVVWSSTFYLDVKFAECLWRLRPSLVQVFSKLSVDEEENLPRYSFKL